MFKNIKMPLKNKLETRISEINEQAEEAWKSEDLVSATTLKKKVIYFKKVLANIIEQENEYHKNAKISNISKIASDFVYKNADQDTKDKIINRTLTREEYNDNLSDSYLPEGGYYDDDELMKDKESLTKKEVEQEEIEFDIYDIGISDSKDVKVKKYLGDLFNLVEQYFIEESSIKPKAAILIQNKVFIKTFTPPFSIYDTILKEKETINRMQGKLSNITMDFLETEKGSHMYRDFLEIITSFNLDILRADWLRKCSLQYFHEQNKILSQKEKEKFVTKNMSLKNLLDECQKIYLDCTNLLETTDNII